MSIDGKKMSFHFPPFSCLPLSKNKGKHKKKDDLVNTGNAVQFLKLELIHNMT